ncbi:MAG: putative toxin-antitoxin system toxin component, PIN family [Chloroflexi bacterium]|nr:putative toxin-antitoxin system toxin component, PIN family [Chloroflexota bacterium]
MPIENETRLVVVVDTNVIISGLNFGGKPREVLDLLRRGEVQSCLSLFILKEVATVLAEGFGWSKEAIVQAIEGLADRANVLDPPRSISRISGKDDDNRILECAVGGKARFIVSGDRRHLLPLKEYKGIKIVTPIEFLGML